MRNWGDHFLMIGEPALDDMRQLRRNGARATILEATRRLLDRVGLPKLTLSSVAVETGFGPSTVFGHFRNKDELVFGVLAEDLAGLATAMRDALPRPPAPGVNRRVEPAPYKSEPANDPVSSTSDQRDLPLPEHQNVVPLRPDSLVFRRAEEAPPSAPNPVGASPEAPERNEGALLDQRPARETQQLEEIPEPASRADGSAESGWAALLRRMEAFEQQQSAANGMLTQRLDEAEKRQRNATAEMRAAINDAALRIEILEAARRGEQAKGLGNRQPQASATAIDIPAARAGVPTPAGLASTDDCTAAQQAATMAAVLAEIEASPATPRRTWLSLIDRRVRLTRKHYMMAGAGALLAFVIGAMLAFYIGQARGREMVSAARRHAVAQTAAHPTAASEQSAVHAPAGAADPRDNLARLAQGGDPRAELTLGLRYLHGEGLATDQMKAAQWIRRAAEQHEPLAQYWLGSLYEKGDGVSADAAEAVRWYEAAAAQGNRKAMHALGVAYAQGMGTQKDYSAAARWFSEAAELGLVNSQFNLGVLYERGLGVRQSLLDAYKWYAIAAANGDQESQARIETLKTQLAADDLAAADGAAQSFAPRVADGRANDLPVLPASMDPAAVH